MNDIFNGIRDHTTAQFRIFSEGLDQKLESFVIFFSFVLWLTSVSPRENRSSKGGESEFVLVILSKTCGIAYCTWITSQICHVDGCDDAHKALSSAPGIFCVMSMSYNH